MQPGSNITTNIRIKYARKTADTLIHSSSTVIAIELRACYDNGNDREKKPQQLHKLLGGKSIGMHTRKFRTVYRYLIIRM